jgi:hypothetical protein
VTRKHKIRYTLGYIGYMLGNLDALAPFIVVHVEPYPRVDIIGSSIGKHFREDSVAEKVGVSEEWSSVAGVSEHVCPIGKVADVCIGYGLCLVLKMRNDGCLSVYDVVGR